MTDDKLPFKVVDKRRREPEEGGKQLFKVTDRRSLEAQNAAAEMQRRATTTAPKNDNPPFKVIDRRNEESQRIAEEMRREREQQAAQAKSAASEAARGRRMNLRASWQAMRNNMLIAKQNRASEKQAAKKQAQKTPEQEPEDQGQAKGRGSGLINPIQINMPGGGLLKFLLRILIFFALVVAFVIFFGQGITINTSFIIKSVIALMFFGFVLAGLFLNKEGDIAPFFISVALIITFIDMLPEFFSGYGSYYTGFAFDSQGLLNTNWSAVIASSLVFLLLLLGMFKTILKRSIVGFLIIASLILIIFNKYMNYYTTTISKPYLNYYIAGIVVAFLVIYLLIKHKIEGSELEEKITYVFMALVFSFFWVNIGWKDDTKALIHMIYILIYGFVYIRSYAESPSEWHILIPVFIILDFFGYGIIYNYVYTAGNLDKVLHIPILLFLVNLYCLKRSKSPYPTFVMMFIAVIILFSGVNLIVFAAGEGSYTFQKQAIQGVEGFWERIAGGIERFTQQGLDYATGGYYSSTVEQNQYESLGVYFSNVRGADPKFYTDQPVTIWGTIKSKTYKDPVLVSFNCQLEGPQKQTPIDPTSHYPNQEFPVFTFDQIDTECTFDPKITGELPAGANKAKLSADYNFGTDAYIKTYFIDRSRLIASSREDIDILAQYGIQDNDPIAVFTNGPVAIGIERVPLVPVGATDYPVKPAIGISLSNRGQITDKNENVYSRWEGRINKVTELVLLTPPGVTLAKDANNNYICSTPFKDYTALNCIASCKDNVGDPCKYLCSKIYTFNALTDCTTECTNSLMNCEGECGSIFTGDGLQGKYNGYQADIEFLNKNKLNENIEKSLRVQCRYNADESVLDKTPITTRYFRVRARYNYYLENKFNVPIEKRIEESLLPQPAPAETSTPGFRTDLPEGVYKNAYFTAGQREADYSGIVFEVAKQYNVDYLFVKAIIQQESSWNPNAVGDGGNSFGLMQVSRTNAQKLGCGANFETDPRANIECGIKLIRELMDVQQKNSWKPGLRNIAGGYNCGEQAMRYITSPTGQISYWEGQGNCPHRDQKGNIVSYTRNYVDIIWNNYQTLKNKIPQ
ncbi:transglycosylase SLT domain-containing protein [Candidatus Woesearchaeota archaeon]|nr:transglycosylase SLT domain-containing protein [Candidatus Woesearchaeota archaeon]